MGFNTTIVIYNDSLHSIGRDPNIGKEIEQACLRADMNGVTETFHYSTLEGGRGSAGMVIECHHTDSKVLVAVGGNTGEVVSDYAGSYLADKLEMLQNFASEMGYTLRKKPKKSKIKT